MDNELLKYILLIGFSLLGILANSINFSKLSFHCNNYILSTYLYFILSWGIVLTMIKVIDLKILDLGNIYDQKIIIPLAIVTFLLFPIILRLIPIKAFLFKHLIFVIYMILIGICLHPLYKTFRNEFSHVVLTTMFIVLVLTFITFMNPDIIDDSILVYLFIGLLTIISATIIDFFYINKDSKYKFHLKKAITYLTIIIFSLFIMNDTKRIIENSKNCSSSPFGPDFITESSNIFLDVLNLSSGVDDMDMDEYSDFSILPSDWIPTMGDTENMYDFNELGNSLADSFDELTNYFDE